MSDRLKINLILLAVLLVVISSLFPLGLIKFGQANNVSQDGNNNSRNTQPQQRKTLFEECVESPNANTSNPEVCITENGSVYFRNQPQPSVTSPTSAPLVSYEGKTICLTQKVNKSLSTECALGLATKDGKNYSVDLSSLSMNERAMYLDRNVQVQGLLKPVNAKDRMMQTYDIEGVIDAKKWQYL